MTRAMTPAINPFIGKSLGSAKGIVKRGVTLGVIAIASFSFSGCSSNPESSRSADFPFDGALSEDASNNDGQVTLRKARDSDDLPPPPPSGSYLGQVSPGLFNQLKFLPLMAPAYIPEGFSLVKHEVPDTGYALFYQSEIGQCFAIEYVASSSQPAFDADSPSSLTTPVYGTEQGATDFANFENELTDDVSSIIAIENPADGADSFPTAVSQSNAASSETASSDAAVVEGERRTKTTQKFQVFDSPVFGPGQKLYFGRSARAIASAEKKAQAVEQQVDSAAPSADESVADAAFSTSASTEDIVTTPPADAVIEPTSESKSKASLVSQWMSGDSGAYRYISGAIVTQNYPAQKNCRDVSLEEAVKIATSLADLTVERVNFVDDK
ncbi:MAG: hypothetical protein AAF050_11940 [Cyanobacteria bacterium J06649_5]